MSKRKQKIVLEGFTFTIGKLIIEQQAEDFNSDELSDNVRNAISQVISAPTRLLTAETSETALPQGLPVADGVTKPKKRRRRPPSAPSDLTYGLNGAVSTRTKTGGARSLVEEMKTEGFFAQDRSIAEIRAQLHTLGHSFKSNELSPVLLSMTKQKSLSRRKDDSGNWVYRAG